MTRGTGLVLAAWLALSGPDGQPIEINPQHIISTRPPRGNEHFHKDVHCLLHTADGKVAAVTESCDEVRRLRDELEQE